MGSALLCFKICREQRGFLSLGTVHSEIKKTTSASVEQPQRHQTGSWVRARVAGGRGDGEAALKNLKYSGWLARTDANKLKSGETPGSDKNLKIPLTSHFSSVCRAPAGDFRATCQT